MAGVRVTVYDQGRNTVSGIDPIMLILPILGVATIGIIVLLFALMGTAPKMVTKRDQLGITVDDEAALPTQTGAIPVDKLRGGPRPPRAPGRVRNKSERSQGYVPDQRSTASPQQPGQSQGQRPVQAPMGSHDGPVIVPDRPGARKQRSFQQADLEQTAEHFDISPRRTPRG
jgi:hypothetical protein